MNLTALAPSPLTSAEQAMLWRQLFQHMPGGLVGLEAVRDRQTNDIIDFRYRFINEVARHDLFQEQSGPYQDVTGQLLSTYFPAGPESLLWPVCIEVIDTQQARHLVQASLFADTAPPVQLSVSPFNDGVLLAYTQTTDDQRTAQALERQSIRLNHILNNSPNALIVFDALRDATGRPVDFRVSMVNRLFEVMTGQQASYFVGMPLGKFYPIESDQMAGLIRLMDTGEPIRREEYVASHDLWLDMVLTRVDDGFVATLYDITGEKKSIDQLERQAQLLEGLMNTVQNGLTVMDAVRDEAGRLIDFVYIEASQSLLKGLNKTREQVIGQRLLTILPGLRSTTLWPIYLRVLETGASHQFESHYKADGFDTYFALSVGKLNDGLVVSYTNITDAKIAQNQLESLVVELRRSNESLEQFAYVASHDLQEPLRKIVSFGDVLQQQFTNELSPSGVDLVRRMQDASARMRALVQDLLTYARLTSQPANHERINLDELVATVLADFGDTIQKLGAELSLGPLPDVQGDSRLLVQLFQNLIGNALKFHQPDQPPRIGITGQLVSHPEALPMVASCAEISITDAGIGFDEKYLDRIFTVFQRLHGRQEYDGTGIGLAICKKVVELHNGAITARSKPGSGTTVTIWLPIPQR